MTKLQMAELRRENGSWVMTTLLPQQAVDETVELFGTATLPTCYMAKAPYKMVYNDLKARNPYCSFITTENELS